MPESVRKATRAEGIAPIYLRISEQLFRPLLLNPRAVHLIDAKYQAELLPTCIARQVVLDAPATFDATRCRIDVPVCARPRRELPIQNFGRIGSRGEKAMARRQRTNACGILLAHRWRAEPLGGCEFEDHGSLRGGRKGQHERASDSRLERVPLAARSCDYCR